jgi:enamine deaminase RidA (YjgF/YER057c/UK114 family)
MINYEKRMDELNVRVPELPPAAGAYVPAVRSGNLVFCSGQGPYREGAMAFVGRVGREVTPEQAYQAARIAVLNCLAEARTLIGSVNNIRRVVQVRGFVNSASDFHEQPKVINGASDLLLEIFGEAGRHARAALGTSNLPSNIPVEIELVLEAR